jgi:hypothetical protein
MTFSASDVSINPNVRCDPGLGISSSNWKKTSDLLKQVGDQLNGQTIEDIINSLAGGSVVSVIANGVLVSSASPTEVTGLVLTDHTGGGQFSVASDIITADTDNTCLVAMSVAGFIGFERDDFAELTVTLQTRSNPLAAWGPVFILSGQATWPDIALVFGASSQVIRLASQVRFRDNAAGRQYRFITSVDVGTTLPTIQIGVECAFFNIKSA